MPSQRLEPPSEAVARLRMFRDRLPLIDEAEFVATVKRVEGELEWADDLRHWTRRMLQALNAYWLHYDGYHGRGNPCSMSTGEDWWIRFEKYQARVESLLAEDGAA